MGTSNDSDAIKRDEVQQIRIRGYLVRDVWQRGWVIAHALCRWMKPFAVPAPKVPGVDQEALNRWLQRELARATEERDTPKG